MAEISGGYGPAIYFLIIPIFFIMNKKKIFLFAGFILIIIFIIYYVLGGLRPVEFTVISNSRYIILGQEYIGPNNSDELKNIFIETKDLLESEFTEAILTIVNDDSKYDDENNRVGYFIGLLVNNVPGNIPDGYIIKEFEPSNVIRARIESHNMVMPKPDKVKAEASKLARSKGFELSEISLEKYLGESTIEVDFLLQ